MDTSISILRTLLRHRRLLAVFAAVAIVAGVLLAYRPGLPFKLESRRYDVGTATVHIFLDTPSSQVVEVAPKGSETLGARASLFANLMAQGELKAAMAKRAGIPPERILAIAPSDIEPQDFDPRQLRDPAANLLKLRVVTDDANVQMPIIEVEAQAADAKRAAALADAATNGLGDYLDSKAADEQVSDAKRLRVTGLGAAEGREIARGPSRVAALALAIFLFALQCGALLLLSAVVRAWRTALVHEEVAELLYEEFEREEREELKLVEASDGSS
jgi:hypothetical protein